MFYIFVAHELMVSSVRSPEAVLSEVMIIRWFGIIAYMCLRLSEFLNPFFYNLASRCQNRYVVFSVVNIKDVFELVVGEARKACQLGCVKTVKSLEQHRF